MADSDEGSERSHQLCDALDRCQAVVEYNLDGTIRTANQQFLSTFGYALEELQGEDHGRLCPKAFASSIQHRHFWEKLNRGESDMGEYQRLNKNGQTVWLRGAYVPVFDDDGKPTGVFQIAYDVTVAKAKALADEGKAQALSKAQAVIEFDMDGQILNANDNFLQLMGYSLKDIVGSHHSRFVGDAEAKSPKYREFWDELRQGKFHSGKFKRHTNNGREVFIQATYNPIMDSEGRPYKVVKFASDVSDEMKSQREVEGRLAAIDLSFGVIEFDLSGNIRDANQNFLNLMGYKLPDVVGQSHKMFCEPSFAASKDYRDHWDKLRQGKFISGQFKRMNRAGEAVWIQAVYNPILDFDGRPVGVVKLASDITDEKNRELESQGKMNAISRSQAVIEFDMSGKIITANENFLSVMGYSLEEVVNQHHRLFVEPAYGRSADYRELWDTLNRGQFASGQFKRLAKGGKEVWIQASYNPILDEQGKPFKVVKFATDITEQKHRDSDYMAKIDAMDKSQAVIEFNLDGTIITANENFLKVVGYSLKDIKGKHHSMFCEPSYAGSMEYRQFWQKLNNGQYDQGEYKRLGAGGQEAWIRASYNPILDLNGKPKKVVKYATDLTREKKAYFELVDKFAQASVELGSAAEELSATAKQMTAGSELTSTEADRVAQASEEVANNVQAVTSSTEELSETVREISQKALETSKISDEAKNSAERAGTMISELNRASDEIGSVIKLISTIAQQTNLLALNATIEAARAGDSGRGFAVVANEVKELANQTADATEQITNKVNKIREVSGGSIGAIKEISGIIERVYANAATTAAATEEQASTAAEVTGLLEGSKQGVDDIVQNIHRVATSSRETYIGASDTLKAAENLAKMAVSLKELIRAVRDKEHQSHEKSAA
ncbi:methyl-accepting chemotaxis sensory transducer with Pas/Pac sensor [Pseudobacteriovorax antillogorgiicola]|uniref:Methyl-accepting chemotaxis sensory transducer with Pas/Pac sensor n=2 Tax=Pseudobacteriovorax antillogorgiicola TaxID=1513793 RepID=A0A1Y6BKL0_9BACT|nr:methyl-accepting chemotaxis sensory transducer with Pas/Pac sensor [Pseudobacteriovorax antillogorgiicola]SMF08126.1 methyl-accepting chemotaxis sensory transducer with Pas/Pac sensor [Pseudobacteriovorax antillogorgiicola]